MLGFRSNVMLSLSAVEKRLVAKRNEKRMVAMCLTSVVSFVHNVFNCITPYFFYPQCCSYCTCICWPLTVVLPASQAHERQCGVPAADEGPPSDTESTASEPEVQCASQPRFLSYVGLAPADGSGKEVGGILRNSSGDFRRAMLYSDQSRVSLG